MDSIGGYFELELRKGQHYHENAIRLNTARSCFEYVLRARRFEKVYIPYYTCEAMLEPILKFGIGYQFYHIDESFEPAILPELKKDEAFLYTNYFGLKQGCANTLAKHYGGQLIIDNSQAFYAEPLDGVDTFYSSRKFFGVADGAYLYTDKRLDPGFERDVSYGRMSHLLKRIDTNAEDGYQDFKKNENMLAHQDIKQMSKLTESILRGIDYGQVKQARRHNYFFLDNALRESNAIRLEIDSDAVPMVYPYFTEGPSLKQWLIENKVFVPTYWPNVLGWCKGKGFECSIAEKACFLPVDQRYGELEMRAVTELINQR